MQIDDRRTRIWLVVEDGESEFRQALWEGEMLDIISRLELARLEAFRPMPVDPRKRRMWERQQDEGRWWGRLSNKFKTAHQTYRRNVERMFL